jgi:hypothetical protein
MLFFVDFAPFCGNELPDLGSNVSSIPSTES